MLVGLNLVYIRLPIIEHLCLKEKIQSEKIKCDVTHNLISYLMFLIFFSILFVEQIGKMGYKLPMNGKHYYYYYYIWPFNHILCPVCNTQRNGICSVVEHRLCRQEDSSSISILNLAMARTVTRELLSVRIGCTNLDGPMVQLNIWHLQMFIFCSLHFQ